ncbi:uncharacterized protein [Prorops nasuta]|uniref:uncharacterized protein n=1 Tax=Prorops nasuta TaxID=863751 RepID=UPI0034CF5A04
MTEEGKKISFGFSKSIKKPLLKNNLSNEEKKVDFIECLDEKAIKVIGGEEKKDEPLVIPLLGPRTWHDRILNKVDADIFEPKTNPTNSNVTDSVKIKIEPLDETSNGDTNNTKLDSSIKIKEEPTDNATNTSTSLEEQAVKEIFEDLKSTETNENKTPEFTLAITEDQSSLRGKEESSLEDYEKIPIDAFGFAMLRGMGWKPGKGIGKNEKVVTAAIPELRPKGMGLGADKVSIQKHNSKTKQEEELKIEKGSFVKIIAGKQSNNYGEIQGLDDDAGRLIVKLALGGSTISLNEFMVQPVSKTEYSKNSKVLNATKYEKYKNKEKSKENVTISSDSEDNAKCNGGKHKSHKRSFENHEKQTKESDRKKSKKYSDDSMEESSDTLRLALVQLAVGDNKAKNIERAISYIERAKQQKADIVGLPECFNSPYGTSHFAKYAETIPDGETSIALSQAAKANNIFIIGGTIPEKENDKLYNTCTIWGPDGELINKHRKMHLFDINIKGQMTFRESESLSPGNKLTTFAMNGWKIGIGICYDIRFEEMARLYRKLGCHLLIYPAAFNMTTGPLHWSLLQRARANDNQLYVACISPARGLPPGYVAWGHTQLTDPWGKILCELDSEEDMIVSDIDVCKVEEVRAQIPTFIQRRTDLYDTIWKAT